MPPSFLSTILLSFLPGMARFFPRRQSSSLPNSQRRGFVSQLCPLPRRGGGALWGRCRCTEGGRSPRFEAHQGFFTFWAISFFISDDFVIGQMRRQGGSPGCPCIPARCCPGHPPYLLGKKGASLNPLYREARPSLQYTSNHWGF